jgi:hypothetical protein
MRGDNHVFGALDLRLRGKDIIDLRGDEVLIRNLGCARSGMD